MDKLKEKLNNLPKQPGVYKFKDKDGGIIYIGKAKNLRSRVGQYFSGHDERPQLPYLMAEAADFDYTVVNNELESLYLESTLIKQYLPKYNIMLRDDKNYAFIKIDYSTQIPQIGYARKIESGSGIKDKGSRIKFFGPYTAAYKIRNTLHLMRKIFPYCSAVKVSNKPCFYYHLHRCPGVCVGKISLDDYRNYLKKIEYFLAGNTGKIAKQLGAEMKLAAQKKQFEKAARLRDQLNAIILLDERQSVILTKKVDWDIVSLASSNGYSCVNLFKVRTGKLRDKENFVYETFVDNIRTYENYQQTEILQKFCEQYYLEASDMPKIIYTQIPANNEKLIQNVIQSRIGSKTEIICPQKGTPKELIKLGVTNAQEYLSNWLSDQAGHLDKINQALEGLKKVLRLPDIPHRIECFDISNIQGTNAVGSMVVFKQGLPAKSEYRKFRIKTKSMPDDFAMMKEMLARRIARSVIARSASDEAILSEERLPRPSDALGARNDKTTWPMPDLIVIDGGKGQLSAAMEVLRKFSIFNFSAKGGYASGGQFSIPIIGLAKRIEEIFIPDKSEPIILSHDDPALQLLQRLRDEAHRFGITYHRSLRSKQAVRSALDDILGIGPKTKKLLKAKFGTVANIRKTKMEDLAAVVGERLAKLIARSL